MLQNLQEFISAANAAEQADKSARVAAAEQAWLQVWHNEHGHVAATLVSVLVMRYVAS
jgi:hypothetical protein